MVFKDEKKKMMSMNRGEKARGQRRRGGGKSREESKQEVCGRTERVH